MTDTSQIPHSREAEEAVIGSILIDPHAYHDVAQFLQADDFYIHRYRYIWDAITSLQEQLTPVDILTVTDALEKAGHLEEIGGPSHLVALINNIPTALHAESYAHIIEQMAIRRRMLEAANQVAKLAYQHDMALGEILDASDAAISDAGARLATQTLRPLSELINSRYEQIVDASHSSETPGIPTGFLDLDRLLNGMQPADYLVIAGRPSQGKTSFLLNIVTHVGLSVKKRVAVFSMEMSCNQVVDRLLQQRTGIDSQRLRSGKLSDDEWGLLTDTVSALSTAQVYVDETAALTVAQLRAKCRRLQAAQGLDLVILDYLQLMSGGSRHHNRQEEVSYISRSIKALAKELNVPVLAAAQLSRAVEQRPDKTPVLSDLRESGSIEMDADTVLFLHRPDPKQFVTNVTVAKQRNGPTGAIDLVFKATATRFENAARV